MGTFSQSNITNTLAIRLSQGSNTFDIFIINSLLSNNIIFDSTITLASRGSGGIMYYCAANRPMVIGHNVNEVLWLNRNTITGINFTQTVTMKLVMSTTSGNPNVSILPLTIEIASL